jgi:hypothetical protein
MSGHRRTPAQRPRRVSSGRCKHASLVEADPTICTVPRNTLHAQNICLHRCLGAHLKVNILFTTSSTPSRMCQAHCGVDKGLVRVELDACGGIANMTSTPSLSQSAALFIRGSRGCCRNGPHQLLRRRSVRVPSDKRDGARSRRWSARAHPPPLAVVRSPVTITRRDVVLERANGCPAARSSASECGCSDGALARRGDHRTRALWKMRPC